MIFEAHSTIVFTTENFLVCDTRTLRCQWEPLKSNNCNSILHSARNIPTPIQSALVYIAIKQYNISVTMFAYKNVFVNNDCAIIYPINLHLNKTSTAFMPDNL